MKLSNVIITVIILSILLLLKIVRKIKLNFVKHTNLGNYQILFSSNVKNNKNKLHKTKQIISMYAFRITLMNVILTSYFFLIIAFFNK